jgi:hypothetical protein
MRILVIDGTKPRQEALERLLKALGHEVQGSPQVWGDDDSFYKPNWEDVEQLAKNLLGQNWDLVFFHVHNLLSTDALTLLNETPVLKYAGGSVVEAKFRSDNRKHAVYEKLVPLDLNLVDWHIEDYLNVVASKEWERAEEVLNGYDPVLEAKLSLLYALLEPPLALKNLSNLLDVLGNEYGSKAKIILRPFDGSEVPVPTIIELRSFLLGE